jgi:hypothetical protein
MELFSQKQSNEMILIDEGSHNPLTKKSEGPIIETHRIRPSITITRGWNSSAIFQRDWESCNCDFVMESENCNASRPSRIIHD